MADSDLVSLDIRLYDSSVPAIQAGPHTVTATLTVHANNDIDHLEHTQNLVVTGPRFALNPGDVYAVYPPVSSQGDFSTTFPHIVLARRTIPWERAMGEVDGLPVPWVALLLFDEDELIAPDGAPSEMRVTTGKVDERKAGTELGEGDVACATIDVLVSVFQAIAPLREELPYLAHVRQVNTEHKEILGLERDGWFSVVMCNRLPNSEKRNIAHLVSLEGLADYLPGSAQAGSLKPDAKVRLVSLASWSFTCVSSAGSFEHLMKNVAKNSGLLTMPPGLSDTGEPAEKLLDARLADGYVILEYLKRDGERSAAWYRGPLVPFAPLQQAAAGGPGVAQHLVRTADQAIVYDPATELVDQSYAVAWQIGRLLALADCGFSLALLNWRRQSHRQINLLDERLRLSEDYGHTLAARAAGDEMAAAPPDGELLRHNRASAWATGFLKTQLGPALSTAGPGTGPLIRPADPSGLRREDPLPGLLSAAEVEEILASGLEPVQRLIAQLFESAGKGGQP